MPIRLDQLPVSLDAEEYAMLQALRRTDLYGDDEGAALRDIVFSWWEENFLNAP